jgi:hypothetical protein
MSTASKTQSATDGTALTVAWTLSGLVSLLAIVRWGSSYGWHLGNLSSYQLFPLLGLLGFSIMWSHYVMGLTKRLLFSEAKLDSYFRWTGYLVLVAIVLHPGILIYQRFRDGYGLPPGSYETYVAPGMAWLTLLGSICFLVFIAFELHRWFGKKSWWKYVIYAGDAAMVGIFYHGLKLGQQLQGSGWYQTLWWFYGLSLILVLAYNYFGKYFHLRGTRTI